MRALLFVVGQFQMLKRQEQVEMIFTIIRAFAMPINIAIPYTKPLKLLGKRKIPAPENIQIMAPAE